MGSNNKEKTFASMLVLYGKHMGKVFVLFCIMSSVLVQRALKLFRIISSENTKKKIFIVLN